MSDKLVIALRLPDKKPSDLKYSEIIELLKQFSALTKGVNDKFGYIQEGSVYLGTAPVTQSQYAVIQEQILNSKDGDFKDYISRLKLSIGIKSVADLYIKDELFKN